MERKLIKPLFIFLLITFLLLLHNTSMVFTSYKPYERFSHNGIDGEHSFKAFETYQSTNPTPTVTPWPTDPNKINPNVPTGQTGTSYPPGFIGPIPNQYAPAGAPVSSVQMNQPTMMSTQYTNPYAQTSEQVNQTQSQPTNPSLPSTDVRSSGGTTPNVGDQETIDGKRYRWNGKGWEPVTGPGTGWGFVTPEGQYYGGTQDEYMREIDSGFNAAQGYFNTAEQNLRTGKSAMEQQAEADFLANQGQLGTQKTSVLGQLDTQQRAGQTRKEDALSAARRLYSELQRGNIQRFGGASSAGQAASEIQGAEAQRQFGQTNRQANEFFQQIETARKDVESQYQSGLLQLQQAKQQALTQAQLEFTNKMTEIARGRAESEQQKSQMRLNALMNLRNQAFQIQQQQTAFEQQLQAMREQSMLNIQQYQKTAGAATQSGANAYGQFNQNTTTSPTSQYGLGMSNQQVQQLPQGVIGRSTNQGGQIWDPIQGRWVMS